MADTGLDEQAVAARMGASGAPALKSALRATLLAAADREGLVDVAYAAIDTPLGSLLAATTRHGLVRLVWADGTEEALLQALAARVSPRLLERPAALASVRRQLDDYFSGRSTRFDVAVDLALVGTPFSRSVLEATLAIPHGQRRTYAEVAAVTGRPSAVRATGTALGRNPVCLVVPCHRVLRGDGSLGGYAGGLERKQWLLAREADRGRE